MKRSKTVLSVLSIAVVGLLALGLTTTPAFAGSTSANLTVTATVQATCIISPATVAFGTYSGTQIQNSASSISVTCTNGTTYNVGLGAGTASGATVTTRKMSGLTSGNTDTLGYSLFRDDAYKNNWGITVGTDTVPGTGTGNAQTLTVYGQLNGSQYPTADSYSDTVTATITW